MNTVEYEIFGQTYHLCFTGAAMFECIDRFGSISVIPDKIGEATEESFDDICWLISNLSEQGELVRRFQGYAESEVLSYEQAYLFLLVGSVGKAKHKIIEALTDGFLRTEKNDAPIDTGLAELERKKNGETTRSQWVYTVTQIFGLSIKEGMLLCPGVVLDMVQLEKNRLGITEEDD